MKFSKLSLSLALLPFTFLGCTSTSNKDASKTAEPEQKEASEAAPAASTLSLNTIYFDFNKYVIRPDQVANAKAIAVSLKGAPAAKIQIQGNTDDRGSAEYNLALGTKRADSLKKYLVAQGATAANISIVSYGKERPAVQGNDESAWSKNRRDDVVEQK